MRLTSAAAHARDWPVRVTGETWKRPHGARTLLDAFRAYAARTVENARALAQDCLAEGLAVVTGGTDNHLLLLDVASTFGVTGRPLYPELPALSDGL